MADQRGFSGSGWSHHEGACAAVETAFQQGVETIEAGGEGGAGFVGVVLGGDQPRENNHAAGLDRVVVISAFERSPAEFLDEEAVALRSVFQGKCFEGNYPVGDALDLKLGGFRAAVVDQDHRGFEAGEKLLHREDLAPEPERIVGEEAEFGQ